MNGPSDGQDLGVRVLAQPTDSVCGPTCLHAVYDYFGLGLSLERILRDVPELPEGGTLAVQLGLHALRQGMTARVYTNDLLTFDPTWFQGDGPSDAAQLAEKLEAQRAVKHDDKLRVASEAYLRFLREGGQVSLEMLSQKLLRSYLDRGIPVMAGLSATYLYDCARELPSGGSDDVAGVATGHFVVIQGYDGDMDHVRVADPLADNPGFQTRYYSVELERLLAAVHLGIVTYDANLLVIEPQG